MPHRRRRRVLCASKVLFFNSTSRTTVTVNFQRRTSRLAVGAEREGLGSDEDGHRPKSRFIWQLVEEGQLIQLGQNCLCFDRNAFILCS